MTDINIYRGCYLALLLMAAATGAHPLVIMCGVCPPLIDLIATRTDPTNNNRKRNP